MSNFVDCDRDQAFLLPPDLRDWIPSDDLAHFVIEAVERVALGAFKVNHRGTGSAQYHPRMMLALLIYCYANGIFSSRRIERATHRDIGVRFIAANLHPDHDTIARFRRENFDAVSESFLQVLLLARELKLLRVGLVSVDGSKFKANASKHRSVTYERATALIGQLEGEIAALLRRAEAADVAGEEDPQALPREIARREALRDKLDAARRHLEAQAGARAAAEREAFEAKVAAREKRRGRAKGKHPKPPDETPAANAQSNLSDPDSRLMRKSKQHEYRQAYNAQAAVDAGGSQLIVSARIGQCASDRNELVADIAAIPAVLGRPETVLADNGYANGAEVAALEARGIEVLVSTAAEGRRRTHDFRPAKAPPAVREPKADWLKAMAGKLASEQGRALYKLRRQTVEPVFGVIKAVLGFAGFSLRAGEGRPIPPRHGFLSKRHFPFPSCFGNGWKGVGESAGRPGPRSPETGSGKAMRARERRRYGSGSDERPAALHESVGNMQPAVHCGERAPWSPAYSSAACTGPNARSPGVFWGSRPAISHGLTLTRARPCPGWRARPGSPWRPARPTRYGRRSPRRSR